MQIHFCLVLVELFQCCLACVQSVFSPSNVRGQFVHGQKMSLTRSVSGISTDSVWFMSGSSTVALVHTLNGPSMVLCSLYTFHVQFMHNLCLVCIFSPRSTCVWFMYSVSVVFAQSVAFMYSPWILSGLCMVYVLLFMVFVQFAQ